jgi:hypothetical protein
VKLTERIAIAFVALLSRTWRISHGELPPKPALIAFFHGFMLPVWKTFARKEATAVVSLSRDGEILCSLLKKYGYSLIRGSSSRGGSEVLAEIVDRLNEDYVLMTPDGPRGPAGDFKPGAVVAAARAKRPLYLCSVEIDSCKVFVRSWDRFRLPLPFTRIRLKFSEAVNIPENAGREQISKIIDDCKVKLNEMQGNL